MAGTIKAMNLIKQVLQLKELGESNRGIARKLPIDKETVNRYMQILSANGWDIPELLKVDDPELERMFHAGSPAYIRMPGWRNFFVCFLISGSN